VLAGFDELFGLRKVLVSISTICCSSGDGSKKSRFITERIRRSYPDLSIAVKKSGPHVATPSFTSWAIYEGLRAHPKARACHFRRSFDPHLKTEVRFRGFTSTEIPFPRFPLRISNR
jgi:hypothetical protein